MSGSYDNSVIVWNAVSGEIVQQISQFGYPIHSVCVDDGFRNMVVYEANRSLHFLHRTDIKFDSKCVVSKIKMKNLTEPHNGVVHILVPETLSEWFDDEHIQANRLQSRRVSVHSAERSAVGGPNDNKLQFRV